MTDKLYRVLIVYREVPLNLNFFYKSEEAGKKAYGILQAPALIGMSPDADTRGGAFVLRDPCEITDDFGNLATVDRSTLSTVVFTDVAEDMKTQSETAIIQAKEQKETQARAQREGLLTAPKIMPANGPGKLFRQ